MKPGRRKKAKARRIHTGRTMATGTRRFSAPRAHPSAAVEASPEEEEKGGGGDSKDDGGIDGARWRRRRKGRACGALNCADDWSSSDGKGPCRGVGKSHVGGDAVKEEKTTGTTTTTLVSVGASLSCSESPRRNGGGGSDVECATRG